jgi:hypothetical protein
MMHQATRSELITSYYGPLLDFIYCQETCDAAFSDPESLDTKYELNKPILAAMPGFAA